MFTLGGPASLAVQPYPKSGEPQTSTLSVWADNPSEDLENGSFNGYYTVTFDLSGLKDVVDVEFGETGSANCEVRENVAVCEDFGVWPGRNSVADLELTAAPDSANGDSGTMKVTAEAEGATFTSYSTEISVGGPDLVVERLPDMQDLKPGDEYAAPIAFANNGTQSADGVLLSLRVTHGLAFSDRYGNCEYSEGEGPGSAPASLALCRFEGTFEPGSVHALEEPFGFEATDRALIDIATYRVDADGPGARTALQGEASWTRGSGPELKLKERAGLRAADLDPWNNFGEMTVRTENTADFAMYGDSVDGAEGETVKAEVGFKNNGPAWVAALRSGEPIATVDVRVPEGATVTGKPEACRGVTADGGYLEKQLGAPRYFCRTTMIVMEDETFALPFELRIDKVVADATGEVAFPTEGPWSTPMTFDPQKENNSARLVLNGTGEEATSGGSDSAGTGNEGDDDTSGGTDAQAAGGQAGGAGTGDGDGDAAGGLALTGAGGVLLGVGAAVVALAVGGALYLSSRRRSAVTEDAAAA